MGEDIIINQAEEKVYIYILKSSAFEFTRTSRENTVVSTLVVFVQQFLVYKTITQSFE